MSNKYINKAFTIVELLVVMAVIGILITLAVVGIQAIQKSQRETVIGNDMRNIQAALVQYYSKYRTYPALMDDLSGEFKVDHTGSKQGVCFAIPGGGDYIIDTDSYDCNIENTDPNVRKWMFNPVETNQLGITFMQLMDVVYSNFDCSSVDTQGGNLWYVGYIAGYVTTNPQSYALFSCSENGKSINYGDKNN